MDIRCKRDFCILPRSIAVKKALKKLIEQGYPKEMVDPMKGLAHGLSRVVVVWVS